MIRLVTAGCFIGLSLYLSSCSTSCGCKSDVNINTYFERIRNDERALTEFMREMPKGGDLHNHFSGSVYAESYWEQIVRDNFFIDTTLLVVQSLREKELRKLGPRYVRISSLKPKRLSIYREKLFREWSIKNYNGGAPDDHFFATFSKFPDSQPADMIRNLKELRTRAIAENVQYIEIMLSSSKVDLQESLKGAAKEVMKKKTTQLDEEFRACEKKKACNWDSLFHAHKSYYELQPIFQKTVAADLSTLNNIDSVVGKNAAFEFRYLAFVRREVEPGEMFRNLLAAFATADKGNVVVGVNIVNREDGTLSMNDYKLHMKMFEFLKKQFRNVKVSMHAGELMPGFVRPEDLTYHIHDAVFTAGADRIGHGVDIAYEKDREKILTYMREHPIPVEINLTSNEFILEVKGDEHPLTLYRKYKVPYVISTDDAGILRTDLTQQYVLLAQRYPSVTYDEIKTVVMNSIVYSFMEEEKKAEIRTLVLERFEEFEKNVAERIARTDDSAK